MEESKQAAGDKSPNVKQVLEDHQKGVLSTDEAVEKLANASASAAGAFIALAQGPTIRKPTRDAPPSWATMPQGVRVPKGLRVIYMRFPSDWTSAPDKGVPLPEVGEGLFRWTCAWELTDSEELLGYKRGMGDGARSLGELAKQMLRVIDGREANWGAAGGDPSSIDQWWTELGPRCRGVVKRVYDQLHVLSPVEQVSFFDSCIESRIGV